MPVNKYKTGLRGQKEAEDFLIKSGHIILERNYRLRTGEIDLIASHGGYIIFIEVKLRSGLHFGFPSESVGGAKQQKIIRTALHYIAAKNLNNQDFRFDVIEILEKNGRINVNHIENAFGM
ncbi:MAG: YraN family protein [Defluviitaleaceae bacterium]|nr:YraN family protein [Defluviitaleaceae bacterium]